MWHYRCHGLRRIDHLAAIMKDINSQYTFDTTLTGSLQRLDGYSPVIFFDCGDYVSKLCSNQELLAQFNEQLNRTVPFKRNTDYFYSMSRGKVKIETFSGITISDPSTNDLASAKKNSMVCSYSLNLLKERFSNL